MQLIEDKEGKQQSSKGFMIMFFSDSEDPSKQIS
jgi:hypothetical protein